MGPACGSRAGERTSSKESREGAENELGQARLGDWWASAMRAYPNFFAQRPQGEQLRPKKMA